MNSHLKTRLYFVDWLRVLAMFCIFLFHSNRFFDLWDWHLKNETRNIVSSIHISFFSHWMMPLFFVLSGAAVFYSLRYRSPSEYLRERLKRLLIPFILIGYFLTSPPQIYLERLTHSAFKRSFIEFIPHYFDGFDMFGGNFPWHGFHLWYLLYLIIFSIALLPLILPRKTSHTSIISSMSGWFETSWTYVFLIIPLICADVFVDMHGLGFLRVTGGWTVFSYALFFLYGYLFFSNPRILDLLNRYTKPSLFSASGLSVVLLVGEFWLKLELETNMHLYLMAMLVRALCVLFWISGILGLGMRWFNFSNRFLKYANEAVLPFYILHQTILLLVGYFILQWDLNAFYKYIIIAVCSFAVITMLYHFLVRPFNPVRFLFGMKPRER